MSVYHQPSLTKIPGYFTIQVHPENEGIPFLKDALEILNPMKYKAWSTCGGDPLKSHIPDPSFADQSTLPSAPIQERYHFCMTQGYINFFQQGLSGILPPETIDYFAALKYVENTLLKRKIRKINPDQFLDAIHRIHSCLNRFKDEGDGYRTNPLFIPTHLMPKERTKSTFSQVDRHILKDANPQQRELWSKSTRLKVWNLAFSPAKASLPLSQEEKQLVKPIMTFGAEHEAIPEKMQLFAKAFCEKIKNEEDLDTLCAWTHQTLVDIHPYNDGNGRTARLLMNTIRMCVGKQPLLIDDDESYTLATEEHDPKVFYDYLQRLKEKQIIPTPFIDQCIRTLFEET